MTTELPSQNAGEPDPMDLVRELDSTLHDVVVARPCSPRERWTDLLDEVAALRSGRCHACLHRGWGTDGYS